MLCDNCGKREANVRYTENINGKRTELNLCEECSKKLGIGQMNFSMPIDFPNFLGSILDDFDTTDFIPLLSEMKSLKCNICGHTFDDIVNSGKVGCENCYDVFEDRIDNLIKRIQGSNRHVGRIGKIIDKRIEENNNLQKENKNIQNEKKEIKAETKKEDKVEKLKNDLKLAIKEERYEDAAKIRDEIKKLEK